MPGRKEFRLGLQPVFQVPADGPARGLPKLVSPLSDLIAVVVSKFIISLLYQTAER